MNLGHLCICLAGIIPSNKSGTEREILPYMLGDNLGLPYMVIGQSHWSWNTIPGMEILFNYIGQKSELV